MKLRLIFEEVQEKFAATQSLIDLIVAAKASGMENISTVKVAQDLQAMGHSFTPQLIAELLNNTNIVAQADENLIYFVAPSNDELSDEDESEKKVEDIASQSAMKNIKAKD